MKLVNIYPGDLNLMGPSVEFTRLIDTLKNKNPEDDSERDIQKCLRLILTLAKKYERVTVEYEDLVQQAIWKLLKVRDNYDEKKLGSFFTYAYAVVIREMQALCRSSLNILYVPSHIERAAFIVKRIMRLLTNNQLSPADSLRIVLSQEELPISISISTSNRIKLLKSRIQNIAKNSCTSYETIAQAAYFAMGSSEAHEAVGTIQSTPPDLEDKIIESQIQEMLMKSLGEKRYIALKLYYDECTHQEISDILFEAGFKNKDGSPIGRSAVRSMVTTSIEAIKKMELFRENVR